MFNKIAYRPRKWLTAIGEGNQENAQKIVPCGFGTNCSWYKQCRLEESKTDFLTGSRYQMAAASLERIYLAKDSRQITHREVSLFFRTENKFKMKYIYYYLGLHLQLWLVFPDIKQFGANSVEQLYQKLVYIFLSPRRTQVEAGR